MPNITYSLGETSFDAVPESLDLKRELPVTSESTLARGIVHSVGTGRENIVLVGKYMTVAVKNAIETLFEGCCDTGASVVLDDGYTECDVLIKGFETSPIVGKTEGYSFRIELVVV